MAIQLPNYQASVDRTVRGFDNALQAYREKKKREAENRQFVRRKMLQDDQQSFRIASQRREQQFREQLSESQEDLRIQLQESEQDWREQQAEENRQFQDRMYRREQNDQEEMTQMQMNAKAEAREDQQEHETNLAETRNERTQAQITSQTLTRQQKRKESAMDYLDKDKNSKVLNAVGAQAQAFVDDNGVTKVAVSGGPFSEDGETVNVNYDQFRSRMNTLRGGYRQIQDIKKLAEKENVRHVHDNSFTSGIIREDQADGEQRRYYPFETAITDLTGALERGEVGEGSIFDKFQQGLYQVDRRSSLRDQGQELMSKWEGIQSKGKPEVKIGPEETITFDFQNDTYGELREKYRKASSSRYTSPTAIDSRDGPVMEPDVRERNASLLKEIDKTLKNYSSIINTHLSEKEDVTYEELKGYKLNSDISDPRSIDSYLIKPNSTQKAQEQEQSLDAVKSDVAENVFAF